MDEVFITVVVPVYNVEKYIDQCLISLINQTYDNYEIILIDDGSTDSSGVICDKYAEKNNRVRVYHKSNGGLSDARNFALDYAKGEYVTFVDSDDYVELDYLKELSNYVYYKGKKNDVVISLILDEFENTSIEIKQKDVCVSALKNDEALEMMCYEQVFGTSACAKLISIDLVKSFLFPKGKLYEDLATVYKYIGEAEGIVLYPKQMYHYVQRSGSIRRGKWDVRYEEVMSATADLYEYIMNKYPSVYKGAVHRYFFSASEYLARTFCSDDYLLYFSKYKGKLKTMWPDIASNKKITIGKKIKYWLMTFCLRVYHIAWRISRIKYKLN